MPYTKLDLQTLYSLSPEEVEQTLTAVNLPLEKETYTDEEIQSGFDVIRSYFNSGQVSDYTAAAELFSQQQRTSQELETQPQVVSKQPRKSKKSNNSNGDGAVKNKPLDISELLSQASEKCGTRIKLSEATNILAACGLPDQEEYSQEECDRFLEACDQIKNQGKTDDEVAAHFGAANEQSDIQADVREILGMIGSAAVATESDLLHVLNELSVKRGRAISEMYDRLLLTQVAQQLKERQKARAFLADFGERLEAYVEGKSPVRAMRMLNPTSSDQSILKILPSSLDNS
jgi:hypothetical protein